MQGAGFQVRIPEPARALTMVSIPEFPQQPLAADALQKVLEQRSAMGAPLRELSADQRDVLES